MPSKRSPSAAELVHRPDVAQVRGPRRRSAGGTRRRPARRAGARGAGCCRRAAGRRCVPSERVSSWDGLEVERLHPEPGHVVDRLRGDGRRRARRALERRAVVVDVDPGAEPAERRAGSRSVVGRRCRPASRVTRATAAEERPRRCGRDWPDVHVSASRHPRADRPRIGRGQPPCAAGVVAPATCEPQLGPGQRGGRLRVVRVGATAASAVSLAVLGPHDVDLLRAARRRPRARSPGRRAPRRSRRAPRSTTSPEPGQEDAHRVRRRARRGTARARAGTRSRRRSGGTRPCRPHPRRGCCSGETTSTCSGMTLSSRSAASWPSRARSRRHRR